MIMNMLIRQVRAEAAPSGEPTARIQAVGHTRRVRLVDVGDPAAQIGRRCRGVLQEVERAIHKLIIYPAALAKFALHRLAQCPHPVSGYETPALASETRTGAELEPT
jgi:hypothetical protein